MTRWDAATGRIFWTLPYTPAPEARACCGRVNRGLAILGDTLYMGTLDAHLLAIDAADRQDYLEYHRRLRRRTVYAITHAPLIVKDKVIVGTGGRRRTHPQLHRRLRRQDRERSLALLHHSRAGRAGQRNLVGRFLEDRRRRGSGIPEPTIPETNLTYWGIGNPAPDTNGDVRLGDNLYSDCVVALDADTGKLKWYYQFTPHDTMDYDSTQVPVLADIEYQGRPRKVMMWANRNGVLYVLDRTNGQFLLGKPFVKANWTDGFDEKGRPMRVPGRFSRIAAATPRADQPNGLGGTNWYPPSYSPRHRPVLHPRLGEFKSAPSPAKARIRRPTGNTPMARHNLAAELKTEEDGFGIVRAFDPEVWRHEVGIQDDRHHLGRSSLDRVRSRLQRRARWLLLRARRQEREPAVEAEPRRPGE